MLTRVIYAHLVLTRVGDGHLVLTRVGDGHLVLTRVGDAHIVLVLQVPLCIPGRHIVSRHACAFSGSVVLAPLETKGGGRT